MRAELHDSDSEEQRMKRVGIVMLWVVTLLAATVMVGPGVQKFIGPTWQRMFRVWGYPEHFYLVVGAIEVLAGIGLLVPRLASACAVALMIVMAGAAATHLLHGQSPVGDFVFFAMLGVVAFARWPGVLRRLRRV
jgi:putative oxidoreductase